MFLSALSTSEHRVFMQFVIIVASINTTNSRCVEFEPVSHEVFDCSLDLK